MHIKMYVRTSKFAKFFRELYPRAQIQQGREQEWGKNGREDEEERERKR